MNSKGYGWKYTRGTPGGSHLVTTGSLVVSSVNCPPFEDFASLYLVSAHGVMAGSSLVKVAPAKARMAGGLRIIQTPVISRAGAGAAGAAGEAACAQSTHAKTSGSAATITD